MRSLLVVEGEELVESSEPPAVLIVGLKEPFDLTVRLRPSNLAQRVFNVMIVEVLFEFMIETRPLVLVCIDEL